MLEEDGVSGALRWEIENMLSAIVVDHGVPLDELHSRLLDVVSSTMQHATAQVYKLLPEAEPGQFQPRSAAVLAICLMMGRGGWRTCRAKAARDRMTGQSSDAKTVDDWLRRNGFDGNLGWP
jgi:hypothetical protein